MICFTRQWMARRWPTALLVAVLACRALVPAGYMPGMGGLMLCPGYAPVPATRAAHDMAGMDMSSMDMAAPGMAAMHAGHGADHGPAHGSEHALSGQCVFAAAAGMAAVAPAGMSPLPPELVPTTTAFPPERILPRGRIVPTRLARGPPALS
jgi:hypothetical protein